MVTNKVLCKYALLHMTRRFRTSVLENISLSTKSATPSSRVLLSAKATPMAFVLTALLPGAAGVLATLIAITIGADTMSVLTKRRSSTADRFPGDAWRTLNEWHRAHRAMHTYLFVENKLGRLLPLACFWYPYLHLKLFAGQRITKEALGKTLAEGDTREPRATAEVLDDRVGTEDMCRNVERIGAMCGVVLASKEKAHGASLRRFCGELGEERAESGVRGVV